MTTFVRLAEVRTRDTVEKLRVRVTEGLKILRPTFNLAKEDIDRNLLTI